MSSTNKTSNYELSQFLGTDKPAWLSDYNTDMSKIDAQMKLNADGVTAATGASTTNTTNIGTLSNLTTDEKTSLVAAVNEVDSHADSAGNLANSANTTANAAKTEAEEAGESTEGMANSVSELRGEILRLTGQKVDIQIDEDTFKSTYQILQELSNVWDDLTDVSQANLLELIGGKRNTNAGAADENAHLAFSACYCVGHRLAVDGIIGAIGAVGAEIDQRMPLAFQIFHDMPLHIHGNVIVSNCDLHYFTSFNDIGLKVLARKIHHGF